MIIFVHNGTHTFVRQDIAILSELEQLQVYAHSPTKKLFKNILGQIRLLFFMLRYIFKARLVYVWFADYHSLLPIFLAKLFGKPAYLVLGGYDTQKITQLGYGVFCKPLRAFFARTSMHLSGTCLCVSNYTRTQALLHAPRTRTMTVYNAIELPQCGRSFPKEKIVLTVALANDMQRYYIKGLDFFIETAKKLPDTDFYIVGIGEALSKQIEVPTNLHIIPPLTRHALAQWYARSAVYCQFSLTESFCLSLVEAIAAGCTPVIVDVGALVEITDEMALVTPRRAKIAAASIQAAFQQKTDEICIKSMKERFSMAKRRAKLHELLKEKK